MPHLYPVVIPGGAQLQAASLGFHAYSLRIDNLSNQWLQEQTTLAWIPPYSLGTCLRMYGAAVAIITNNTPTGQPQLAPIAGEYAAGFFSDEYRTEVAGVPVRQFTLVQAVSDLTEGPQPAPPPVGVDRLWADASGNIHHLHSNGVDLTLVDPSQVGVVTTGMILDGTIQSVDLAAGAVTRLVYDGSVAGDQWNNAAFAAGNTSIPAHPVTVSGLDSDAAYFIVVVEASAQILAPQTAGLIAGWDFFFQNTRWTRLTRVAYVGGNVMVSCSASMVVTTVGAAAYQFGLALYTSVAGASGLYMLCASAPDAYFARMQIIEVRR